MLSYKYRAKKENHSVKKIQHTSNYETYGFEIDDIMKQIEGTNAVLPFTTTLKATIRTKSEDPV